jgi:hypothetical protein
MQDNIEQDHDQDINDEKKTFFGQNRFVLLIVLSIIVTVILVVTGMELYNSSGAAQIDMSRPGYQDVRGQVDNGNGVENYSSSGEINQQIIDDFLSDYSKEATKIQSVDAFGGDPLNVTALGLSL